MTSPDGPTRNPITKYREAESSIQEIERRHGVTCAAEGMIDHWETQDDVIRRLLGSQDDHLLHIARLLLKERKLVAQHRCPRSEIEPHLRLLREELSSLEREIENRA
jgi:hypothetical protein